MNDIRERIPQNDRYKSYCLKPDGPIYLSRCFICNNLMELTKIDYRFEGNQDEYWACYPCRAYRFVKVRYGRICKMEKHVD